MAIIGVDIDGVLANYVDAMIEAATVIGKPLGVSIGDIPPTYDMREGEGWFDDGDHFFAAHRYVMSHADMVAPLVEAAPLHLLKESGHTLIAVTMRGTENMGDVKAFREGTLAWVDKHFDGVLSDVVFTDRKDCVGVDVMVEDKGDTVLHMALSGIPTVLVSYTYNEEWSAFATEVRASVADALGVAGRIADAVDARKAQ